MASADMFELRWTVPRVYQTPEPVSPTELEKTRQELLAAYSVAGQGLGSRRELTPDSWVPVWHEKKDVVAEVSGGGYNTNMRVGEKYEKLRQQYMSDSQREREARQAREKEELERERCLRENVARMNARNRGERLRREPRPTWAVSDKPAGQLTFNHAAPRTPSRPAPAWVRQALWFMLVCACAIVLASIANLFLL